MADRRLIQLWNKASPVLSITLKDNQTVRGHQSFLIRHESMKYMSKPMMDDYWKGLVIEMRMLQLPELEPQHFVRVLWFYTKTDILDVVKGGKAPEIERYLQTMGEQELCISNHENICNVNCLECPLTIPILQDDILCQEPAVDGYFARFAWICDSEDILGECICQCQASCKTIWEPDQEEQRYCWGCKKWFNTSCLSSSGYTQSSVVSRQLALGIHKEYARILIEVAFQPTARGGSTHFVSGNGRIVRQARKLLEEMPDSHSIYIALEQEGEGTEAFCREEAWTQTMEEIIGLEKKHRGNINEEQLIIRNQEMFSCPLCQSMLL